MKYLSFSSQELGPVIVAFSSSLSHADVAVALGGYKLALRSAGFIERDGDGFRCFGDSNSLGIRSLAGDSRIATIHFNV